MEDDLRGVFVDRPRRISAPMRAEPNHTDVTVSAHVETDEADGFDEASADHPVRTLRPASSADVGDGDPPRRERG